MSRKSDIKALVNLRDQITETKFMIQMSETELKKYETCEKELTTSRFVFEPLPTNQAEVALTKFRNKWIEKYEHPSGRKYHRTCNESGIRKRRTESNCSPFFFV